MTTTPPPCCREYAGLSRRGFLAGAVALAGTTTVLGQAVLTTSAGASTPAGSVFVVLSLRGAADGLSLVVPHGDPVYYGARPHTAVPAERLLARDEQFGLHPALQPLLPLWNDRKLAAVHSTGLPAPNRSHFAAMEEVEDAAPGSATRVGWLNRLIGTDTGGSPLQGLGLGGSLPTSLYGPEPVMSAGAVDEVVIPGEDQWDDGQRRRSLRTLWGPETSRLGRAMQATMTAVDEFAPVRATPAAPANAAPYPSGDLGQAMAEAARVVRGDVGVEVITIDHGEWDMHTDIGTVDSGPMRQNAGELAAAVAAFFTDLGALADQVTLVTISEFGRRVAENGSRGFDHGYGNVMLLAGAGVNGGGYFGSWKGLQGEVDSDVQVTTDYRSVLAEVVASRFAASTSTVFPGFIRERVGVMAGQ